MSITLLTDAEVIQKQIDSLNGQQALIDAQYALNCDRIAKQIGKLQTDMADIKTPA